MPLIEILALALALALDAFAVAVAVGAVVGRLGFRHYFRLAWHFGLFQALMPILGWAAGSRIASFTAAWDHWLAFGLLSFLGIKMLLGAGQSGLESSERPDPTRGVTLLLLSVATSLDALAVGFSLAVLGAAIARPAVIIGIVACLMTVLGLWLGRLIGTLCAAWAQRAGGLILILIGVKIFVEHLAY